MDTADELIARARLEAGRHSELPSPSALEALRAEAARLFGALPEPPSYRRANDPVREQARAQLDGAVGLLGRLFAARRALPEDERLERLARAVELHVRALAAIAAADIPGGDHWAHEAWESARELGSSGSFFRHQPAATRKRVFDPASGESRYDPQPEASLTVQLYCPNEGCRAAATYAIAPRYSTHRFTCSHCRKPFSGHFGELKSAEAHPAGRMTHHVLHVNEVGGGARVLEFDDASGNDLAAYPRDLLVLLYAGTGSLAAVENLSSGRVLWIEPKGACFLATAVYGADAPELAAFRAFRDRTLMPTRAGRWLVRGYYRAGPVLARAASSRPALRRAARALLERIRPWVG
ncbi:MAG: CFI-box-CTERM domain-containing protein [Myxococcales bacterium]